MLLVSAANGGNATDRCRAKDCTCVAKEIDNSSRQSNHNSAEVYFAENSDELDAEAKALILKYLNSSTGPLYISGFTDQCGNEEYNISLSKRRAEAVRYFAQKESGRVRSVMYYGESHSSNHKRSDRKVIISTYSDLIVRAMDAVKADAYLLDASGSISKHWPEIIQYDFPNDAKIYISKMNSCSDGDHLTAITPGGGTEIWYSYYHVIKQMNNGQTLLIVSDFNSNVQLSENDYNTIERIISEKQIVVKIIKY
jgi:hypothetical protein